jgi:hypothetical protein
VIMALLQEVDSGRDIETSGCTAMLDWSWLIYP